MAKPSPKLCEFKEVKDKCRLSGNSFFISIEKVNNPACWRKVDELAFKLLRKNTGMGRLQTWLSPSLSGGLFFQVKAAAISPACPQKGDPPGKVAVYGGILPPEQGL